MGVGEPRVYRTRTRMVVEQVVGKKLVYGEKDVDTWPKGGGGND